MTPWGPPSPIASDRFRQPPIGQSPSRTARRMGLSGMPAWLGIPTQAALTSKVAMASIGTRTVEIDSELLDRLRQHSPGRSDRETLERVARIQLGFETIRAVQERSEAAGVDDDEVVAEAVRAVRETRQARSTRRAAG
jgi:hypothetical protein